MFTGTEYVYFQYSDPFGAQRQFSIGQRDAALDRVIANYETSVQTTSTLLFRQKPDFLSVDNGFSRFR